MAYRRLAAAPCFFPLKAMSYRMWQLLHSSNQSILSRLRTEWSTIAHSVFFSSRHFWQVPVLVRCRATHLCTAEYDTLPLSRDADILSRASFVWLRPFQKDPSLMSVDGFPGWCPFFIFFGRPWSSTGAMSSPQPHTHAILGIDSISRRLFARTRRCLSADVNAMRRA